MKKQQKNLLLLTTLTVCFILTGCGHEHTWAEATCTEPKTCSECGKTEGEPLGHTWVEATCAEPKHCSVCGETEGETLEHTWVEATCAEPKHCSVCGKTEGEALEHTWIEANYQQPATCEVCGETEGEAIQAEYEKRGIECNAELDTPYPYTVPCYLNPNYTTTGTATFSDYQVFQSDETHESLDGYEWKTITLTSIHDDENAQNYGDGFYVSLEDYYSQENESESWNEPYMTNFNGIDYTECLDEYKVLVSDWVGNESIYKYQFTVRVPKGYDGRVITLYEDDEHNTVAVSFRLD